MTTYNTRNPLGSAAAKDLYDNAQNLDHRENDLSNETWPDRLGVSRLTWFGIEKQNQRAIANYGYITMDSFQAGATLTLPNQVLRDTSTGEYYRWDGTLPKIVTAGSTPATAGGVAIGAWVSVGDASLRANLGSSDGLKYIGRCANIATLRSVEPTIDGQKIEVVIYASGYKSWADGNFYCDASDSTSADDGWSVIVTAGGKRWKRKIADAVYVEWCGIPASKNIDTAYARAAVYAKANKVGICIGAGAYVATQTIAVDIGFFSLTCPFGAAQIDFTGLSNSAGLRVFSSAGYPDGMNRNTTNRVIGIHGYGSRTSGQTGILTGHDTNDYNGQSILENCSFHDFGKNINCGPNTWRYKFINCGFNSPLEHQFYAPYGIANSGENISFDGCWFADSKNCPIEVACSNFSIMFVNTSIVNTRVLMSGNASHFFFNLGNIENPKAENFYNYVELTGLHSEASITDATIVMNSPELFTDAPFKGVANSTFKFTNVKVQSNNYPLETTNSIRAWVNDAPFVFATGCSYDYTSGGVKAPLSRRRSPISDPGFETGGLTHWEINNASQVSQTAQVIAEAAKNGSYGLRLTSISGYSIYAVQRFPVTPGVTFSTQAWGRVITAAASGNSGTLSIDFYNYEKVQIPNASYSSNLTAANTDWTVIAGFVSGVVPAGAAYAQINLRAANGAVVDYDDVIPNLI
ncbi:hypothetical protein [Pantoea phytobeneficialis]|uniref:Tail spike TSP1/Gp66 N-terminal domain-containing protein n=1 Tax=Pantoea phytobeneficialis TaxID=2052056 RepID=A0ABT8XTK3_9GAMM|nr:hypothetical protein [Pantoea phytobeneficialis]MDO6406250.1 hypothetical protein [Pantoea phytobeneficialis]